MDRSTLYNVDNLKTGDIILFSGRCVFSRVVRVFTNSKWTHIGIVVIDPEYPYPLIYESSHGTDVPCLNLGATTTGVQLLPFNERRRTFKGDMALRRLNCELNSKDLYRLRVFMRRMVGVPFEKNKLRMLCSAFPKLPFPSRKSVSSISCIELMVRAYRELGLLGRDRPSNRYCPADFTADGNIPLTRGKLGPQITIKEYRK